MVLLGMKNWNELWMVFIYNSAAKVNQLATGKKFFWLVTLYYIIILSYKISAVQQFYGERFTQSPEP